MGPTAAGKTELALEIISSLPEFAIISVDSAMVYRELNIGAAKPSLAELRKAPHQLINTRSIREPYSAAEFVKDAKQAINEVIQRHQIPLLVGGTMLYFRALQQGLAELPMADMTIRKKIAMEAQQKGWQALHQQLAAVDPEAAKRIHPNDPQRLQRALEVYYVTHKPLTTHFEQSVINQTTYQFINLGLLPEDRAWLHNKIALRFKAMLAQGLIQEVEALFKQNLDSHLPALRTVGYRQIWQYLAGQYDQTMMIEKAIAATRQLAKRQLTWLRSWPELKQFYCEDPALAKKVIEYLSKHIRH
ncbi:MAG: tRNA (adenosine(37)-N6)-dimethylallyltransferase MiaA [Gammaproteobacteria bacterium RIFCSPHIGHO2_12_FULL_35_23]|nr:MAG: tRNA (adenosine(37)-N6)-dimethylallyltransferase MiaA [Gammaproteobacteria bacterium RIFCSPHIGHO2_12_FULL_35_23]